MTTCESNPAQAEYKIYIERDEDPLHPRKDFDCATEIFHCHRNYDFGTKIDPADIPDIVTKWQEEGRVFRALYMYEHSGIALSLSPFGCNFDSGQLGWIVANPDWVKDLNEEQIVDVMKSELAIYQQYLDGDVWGFRIVKLNKCGHCGHVDEEEENACWGFYGEDLEGMKEHFPENTITNEQLKAAWNDRKL